MIIYFVFSIYCVNIPRPSTKMLSPRYNQHCSVMDCSSHHWFSARPLAEQIWQESYIAFSCVRGSGGRGWIPAYLEVGFPWKLQREARLFAWVLCYPWGQQETLMKKSNNDWRQNWMWDNSRQIRTKKKIKYVIIHSWCFYWLQTSNACCNFSSRWTFICRWKFVS